MLFFHPRRFLLVGLSLLSSSPVEGMLRGGDVDTNVTPLRQLMSNMDGGGGCQQSGGSCRNSKCCSGLVCIGEGSNKSCQSPVPDPTPAPVPDPTPAPVPDPTPAPVPDATPGTATTCEEATCDEHPTFGYTMMYSTCDDTSGAATCGCQYADDVWPTCLGPTANCDDQADENCLSSQCNNWGQPGSSALWDSSNCWYLICNTGYRVNGPYPQCTCSQGTYHFIDDGVSYTSAAGCAM
jgi:hypothetical protein